MAHFAQIDENNIVINVLVVNNSDIGDVEFPESETAGIAYLNSLLPSANYKQTSYNKKFRCNYAGPGYTFLPEWGANGGFRPPSPYPSWILNNNNLQWEPPVPIPSDADTIPYRWDEETVSWICMVNTIKPVVIG